MDSDDKPLGFVRELGDGLFSLAGAKYRIGGDDSAFARLRWFLFVRVACDDLERVVRVHEFDGSTVNRIRHARSSQLREEENCRDSCNGRRGSVSDRVLRFVESGPRDGGDRIA